ncbi:MAG: thioredoxin domain-containing protein [Elusimicrobia bacterium]|nr:thioredoxin domain-containing protein [Elusimicrobiota bacterium]
MNHLADEKSPYLLQHRTNPVDWYPWGDAAFEKAKTEDKPVFLSIGYAACHWCHVMERESFSDASVAEELNKRFVCVKVDREERPEVDSVYMSALHAMGRPGGWPLSMWLTPDRKPFFGATYMPPDSLKALAANIEGMWKTRRPELEGTGATLLEGLGKAGEGMGGETPGPGVLDAAVERLQDEFDPEFGGFGSAPKFPQPSTLAFLLRYSDRSGDNRGTAMVLKTLRAMAAGGIHDQLGGGFHRYATDEAWLVPHFEKMLYDNAQLLRIYVEAHQVTGAPDLADTARSIAGYLLRILRLPGGAFACGEDADSEGVEGKFYVWRPEEVRLALSRGAGDIVCKLYDVSSEGNWEPKERGLPKDRSILRQAMSDEKAAEELKLPVAEVRRVKEWGRKKLLELRAKRVRPLKDDKVLASWNGLAIGALAYAGRVLNEPRWVEASEASAGFVLSRLYKHGRLLRRWRDEDSRFPGGLEDYAFMADGLIDLYEATFKLQYLSKAKELAGKMVELFNDEDGGFFSTASDAPDVPVRLKGHGDGALPAGNSQAARVLIRLSEFYLERSWLALAEKTIRACARLLTERPEAMPCMLSAVDLLLGPRERLIVVGKGGVARSAEGRFLPRAVLVKAGATLPSTEGAAATRGRPLVYVCRGQTCLAPAATELELDRSLSD